MGKRLAALASEDRLFMYRCLLAMVTGSIPMAAVGRKR